MSDDFLSAGELAGLGVGRLGRDVSISRHALVLRPDRLVLGDRVRIDAFAIVSTPDDGIEIGSDVHLSAHAVILGRARTVIGNFCAVSVRVTILTSSDDFSGATLAGAGVPDAFRDCRDAPVVIHDHVIIGAGSVVLPGVTIHAGAAVGALSLVTANVPELTLVAGVPARVIKPRQPGHRALARELEALRDAERDR